MRRESVTNLHADAGHFFVLAKKHAGMFGRHGGEPVRLAQVQRQDALQATDVVPNADRRGLGATEVEQRITDDLARSVVRELSASLGEHKVRAEGGQSRAFGRGFGLRLAASAGVDGLVLEEEKDVLVVRR